ncbi:MAG: extracellular solute-binding protein [Acholeplasmatales bacterium]|jgi:spermidine/putrescine-binding protein|nr:extracellular solute-binding protein [Acholeplasmatales bacterium]
MFNKKILCLLFLMFTSIFAFSSCKANTLLLLNWGEYINEDLLDKFEDEYGVSVQMSIADSNELFYSKVMSGTTVYDLVIPSDYMIEKMVLKDVIQKIDFSKLENYDSTALTPGVKTILDSLSPQNGKDPKDYTVPYFWGTFGIIYNKQKAGLEDAISNPDTAVYNYFNPSTLPSNTRIGMYDTPRFVYGAALQSLGLSPNELFNAQNNYLNITRDVIKNSKIYEWGFDTLKYNIVNNNLDLAYTWTGDMLDMLYMQLDEGKTLDEMTFDIVIPSNPIAFMDAFVIPTKARNVDLAHKFIDFFLDPVNAYENASTVGYCTPVLKTYNWIINPLKAEEDGIIESYVDDKEWLDNWAYANNKYYPLNSAVSPFTGIALSNFDQSVIDKINQMINQVKAS